MNSEYALSADKLLEIFGSYLTVSDINASRILAEISCSIIKKRIEFGMTQKEFAKFLDVSQSMVSKWESKDYNFTIQALAEIFDKLNLNFDILIQKRTSERQNLDKIKLKSKDWDFQIEGMWDQSKTGKAG